MRKNIRNYTSEIPVSRTLQNIQDILVAHGAKKIVMDYDSTRQVSGITFGLEIKGKLIPFTLPVQVEKLATILYKRGRSFNNLTEVQKESVRRTGWKNIYDWIDAQMALIDTDMVKIEQVFLPYVDMGNGQTLYDRFTAGNLLPEGEVVGEIVNQP